MSLKVMCLVWSARGNVLTSAEKSILLRMADLGGHDGNGIYPSMNTLSLDTGLSRSTIIRSISTLEKKCILKKKHQFRKNLTSTSNLYSINVSKLESLSKVSGSEPLKKVVVSSKKGSVTMTPRVVSPRHQGSVTMTPLDPLIDPLHRNNNSKTVKTIEEPVVVFNEDEKRLRQELQTIKMTDSDALDLIMSHGVLKVTEKLKMLRGLIARPSNPIGWIKSACQKDFKPHPTDDKPPSSKMSPWPSSEETKEIINHVANLSRLASTVESKLAHQEAMKQLGRR